MDPERKENAKVQPYTERGGDRGPDLPEKHQGEPGNRPARNLDQESGRRHQGAKAAPR